ncbi:DUF3320 domain-containing protein [Actinomadura sp. 6N118]|uniref:DUF3320 domain-containing protein n=1 Tax=Actinomadura sp. 6N118 TaxID=3375151 RepID=UPI0037A1306B
MRSELPRAQLQVVLWRWRDNLIDLSGRNRLLNFRHTRTATLEIRHPGTEELLGCLDLGWRFADLPDDETEDTDLPVGDDANGIVTQKITRPRLDASVRKLFRDSNHVFNDTGLWILQLGVGFLKWREPGAENFSAAPLLLVPVRLDRVGAGDFRLIGEAGEDVTPNPALAVKMAELGLEWPAADDMKDLSSTLSLVSDAIARQPDWETNEDVVLATFRSHKEAMYRDLRDHEERILDHPMVQAIGLGPQAGLPDDALAFDPVPLDRIDDVQPPEEIPLVLDADSSQRQCIAAALDGRSFVMDGPPGTGKSQTISNMIAALLHAGRSVLFVSEKAAALDVVRNRLDAVGLGAFLLSLHSHHATRKEVAQELGGSLLQRPIAVRASTEEDRGRLKKARRQLSGYAAAMNETRPPLNRTLHDVLGRVGLLADVPLLPTRLPADLSGEALFEILSAAELAGDSWRPIAEKTNFPWRGLKRAPGSPQASLRLLIECGEALCRRLAGHAELARPLGWEALSTTGKLVEMLDATDGRPPIPMSWLTTSDLAVVRNGLDDFTTRLNRLRRSTAAAISDIGPGWDRLPHDLPTHAGEDEQALTDMAPEGLALEPLTATKARGLAGEFEAVARELREAQASLADIAAVYGVPVPETYEQALALCSLTEIARSPHRPEVGWLVPSGREAATQAVSVLEASFTALASARAAAEEVFTERIFDYPDFPGLVRRLGEAHGLGKLSSSHRADKRTLAEMTVTGVWNRSVVEHLPQALAWHQATDALRQAIVLHCAALGRYWRQDRTDFGLIRGVLNTAERVAALAPRTVDPTTFAMQISADGTPDKGICEAADNVRARLTQWRASLVPAPHIGGRPRLAQATLTQAAAWYEAHIPALRAAVDLITKIESAHIVERRLTLGQARDIIKRVSALRDERQVFHDQGAEDERLLGSLYAGLETDPATLYKAFEWTSIVRPDDRSMPESAAQALLRAEKDDELRKLWDSFRAAVTDFVERFDNTRQRELHSRITGTAEEFRRLTSELAADESGPDEWRSFQEAADTLRQHGQPDLIDRAAGQGIEGARFKDVVERALLEAWIEGVMVADSRLSPVRAVHHDKLVSEFRMLDEALVANAHAQVIEACNARRPNPNIGQAADIQREANKKSRHMPVRTLLGKAADVVPLVKPCFMMSPLTVSQFLPPGYHFDVVIFDEASQVLPQDAINCVYRGDTLIVAGDQKQLPPTDFFAQSDDTDDDEYDEDAPDSFDSLLDMCKAAGLIRSLSLNWHYRSRHEGLIAFSNNQFYGNRLVTFPGSREAGDNVGVTFTKVPGVYERGRSRTNPIEARAVAERVLHHSRTRPELSLGVVAMSGSQARAIEDAVDDLLAERPELEEFLSEDRLSGFFVKNLETVQGDERDVIILSVGYGPDESGKLTMAFGPLNRKNGWRRLNVAVTRARHRVEVVSSISGDDIREGDNTSRNHFKRYLDYAERGAAVLEQSPLADNAEPESPFEESVLDVLLSWGYDVQPQVGVGGYRIDLAVRHPEAPGRFALGIECDGAMYHSSRAARDRDRLREDVLRGLGWELYRIWGTDWYRHRHEAQQRLREAVEAAITRPLVSDESPDKPSPELPEVAPNAPATPKQRSNDEAVPAPSASRSSEPQGGARVVMEAVDAENRRRDWASKYLRANLELAMPYHDMHEPGARPILWEIFRKVIEAEAPIHRELLYRRAAEAWGVERVGSRIRANLDQALLTVMHDHDELERDGEFITVRGRGTTAREPSEGVYRKVGEVPSQERKAALLGIIGESPGISQDELTTHAARFFGWLRRGADINRAFAQDLSELQKGGHVEGLPDRVTLRRPE